MLRDIRPATVRLFTLTLFGALLALLIAACEPEPPAAEPAAPPAAAAPSGPVADATAGPPPGPPALDEIPTEMTEPDHVVPGWYQGMPVVMRSFEPGLWMQEDQVPAPEDFPFPQEVSYIVGIADSSIGASPHQTLRLPDGNTLTMPGHQGVLPCLRNPDAIGMGIAYSVIPGPNASEHNLRTDPMPERSVVGAPLATAIKIGPTWLSLTNHKYIEYGLHKGWLRLRFFGAGPTGWATPDWEGNYPYMPAMEEPCDEPARPDPAFVKPQQVAIPEH